MIRCQGFGCTSRVDDLDTPVATANRARYLGWRIYDGPSAAGIWIIARWCPNCVDKNRPRNPKPVADMEGQEMFEI